MPGSSSTLDVVPGRRTAAQLVKSVAAYVQSPDDAEVLETALVGLNNGVDYLNSWNWPKEIGYQDITTILDTQTFSLNSDFKDPHACELLDSDLGSVSRFAFRDWRTFLIEYPVGTPAGKPEVYSIDYRSRLFVLNVACDQTFVDSYPYLRLHYFRRFDRLVQDSNVFDAAPEFEHFLLWYAREEIAAVRRPNQMQYARERWRELFRNLRADCFDTQTDWGA